MTKQNGFKENRGKGTYTAIRDLTRDDIVGMAKQVVGKRYKRGKRIQSPGDMKEYLSLELGHSDNEVFACVFLDARHRVIAFEKMFFGTIDGASVHPRVVAQRALERNAAAIVLTHNHPSGDTDPSEADRRITRQLIDALRLIDVRVLDHIVVGSDPPLSFAERG